MTKHVFLVYSLNAFDANKASFACSDDSGRAEGAGWPEVATGTTVVTYNAAAIVRYAHSSGNALPQSLIDIGEALRLLSGVSRDDGGESKWALWPLIRPFFDSKSDFSLFVDVIEGIAAQPPGEDLTRLLVCAANGLREVWQGTLAAMESCGELERFLQIEVPVQQVFWARQYNGLHFDRAELSALLEKARGDKYSAFRELAAILNMSPTGLTVRTIGPLLQKTDARHLQEFAEQANFGDYLRVAQDGSKFARAFLQFTRAGDDLRILTGLGVNEITHPEFRCFGTVTGRILISDPRLQQLRKSSRTAIGGRPGTVLRYLDYAQFEPGVFASLSGDTALRDAYNSTDLYVSLSLKIFGDAAHRDTCKQVFLAYCFGMSFDSIAKLLAGPEFSPEHLIQYRSTVSEFFKAFPGIESYRSEMQSSLEEKGFVSTVMGNRRVRLVRGQLSNRERRWALNHRIQGTASLIFKRAVIGIASELGNDCVLLPMHDAVLLQFEEAVADRCTERAMQLMKEAFFHFCPGVEPKVAATAFAR